ncbi:hypothetical protein HanXRQr2_Chr09g0371031 [Helianthus annuus]|uniref:Uncharacterized protein n=1 Tax=Helianthus annuus TaxID=4232 RepID=A0A9K3I3Z4_HELAN|nr:hypothetical protein HanXRQr2_Chr09g0371031 [Helianthus annuus]KAJ0891723.1 hypothetical protein HanPSC8_Chr09g0357411 [Helianthus annuus]
MILSPSFDPFGLYDQTIIFIKNHGFKRFYLFRPISFRVGTHNSHMIYCCIYHL